ncbi:ROK family protein [Verrucomicrobiaceae bacterium N1E253]|uniref:ROK family protein n=1 Tax=Oceaniferula marina TaxID=2748318 RepID=A0A851GJ17_9BACT|nr:ROK family protein [Oceaniferula marina]NWK57503.1 ROK family protein [Oceaniferula marina]
MIAAIDLGGTRTKYGLVDDGKVVASSTCPSDARGSLERHLDEVVAHLRIMCVELQITLESCEGLGVLCTGLVDNRAMKVLSTNGKYDDAVDFHFSEWARERTGLPLRMDNDARGALLGEWRYGAGRGVDDLMMVVFGTGIGTAVLIDGKPLTGSHFSGGILGGHILVNSGGRQCTCGAVGCLESEASGWVLPELIRSHALYLESSMQGLDVDTIGFQELLAHAASGDACACAVQEHCFRMWGEALVSFIHLYDPQRIVVGGGLMNSPELVLASFRKTVAKFIWGDLDQVDLVAAQHPNDSGLIGAAALFYLK